MLVSFLICMCIHGHFSSLLHDRDRQTDSHKIAYLRLQSINLNKKKTNIDVIGSTLLQREVDEKKTKTLNLLLPYDHLITFHWPA